MTILSDAKTVAVWGYGKEGAATVTYLHEKYQELSITVIIDNPAERVRNTAISVLYGDEARKAVRGGAFDIIVRSPVISIYRDDLQAAQAKGSRVTSATNLWFEANPGADTIVVTGSKGKSTTARLVQYLLLTCGLDTALLGNVGVPAIGQAPGDDFTVLELSSYQIADLKFPPKYAVITNLFLDHADWHGGGEQYFRDKASIAKIGPDTISICNYENDRLRDMFYGEPRVRWFNAPSGFRAESGRLWFGDKPIECLHSSLKGDHNLSNVAAAATVADIVASQRFREQVSLAGFTQLPHRLQERRFSANLLCVNDSLSTIPEATIAAVEAFAGTPMVLIAGGEDRGQQFDAMVDFLMASNVRAVILLPATGERIWQACQRKPRPFTVQRVPDLPAAVKLAFELVPSPGTILLSPAAPSYGQFVNYAERGEMFLKLCEQFAEATT